MNQGLRSARQRPVLATRGRRWAAGLLALGLAGMLAGTGQTQGPAPRGPVKVTFKDDKPVLNEEAAHPPAVFWQVLGAISDYLWDPERYAPDPGSSFQRWQPILSRWLPQVAPCSPCGSFGAGWTCSPTDRNTIYYCDGRCLTGLPCPGDCQLQPNPHPDICR